jgi:hypothetical protein
MNNLKTYEFGANAEALLAAQETGRLQEHWEGAFRAMVADIASLVAEKPRSIYLCSTDEDADARNRFAFVLAGLLRERIPGIVLVDCDFLSVGLSGTVPHRDALGFLDLLLYGTSLGVITQESPRGAKVVGAGSFAVTKKNPFAADAFVTARRYLVNQAKCVLFVGPVGDDEENLHPIAQNVDVVVLVRVSDRFEARFLDPLEQRVASIEGVEARSVRVDTRLAAAAPAAARSETNTEPAVAAGSGREPERPRRAEPARAAGRARDEEAPYAGASAGVGRAAGAGEVRPSAGEPAARETMRRARSSRAVRVIASLAALSAVVFIVWWLYLTRSVREGPGGEAKTGAPPTAAVQTPPGDSTRAAAEPRDRTAAEPEVSRAGEPVAEMTVPRERTPTSERSGAEVPKRTASPTPADFLFVDTLGRFADQYVIHVSSFRGTDKAKEEALYLAGLEFPVFIYHVDTGSKGMWYRVYVGPYATRDEAVDTKIKLDENPRIRSTRVSKVPG